MNRLIFFCFVLLLHQFVFSQSKYSIAEGSFIKILGTSTLHDWEMSSTQMKSEAEFKVDEDGYPEHVKSLIFSLKVETLTSEKKKLDNNAYEALKKDKYPEIHFKSNSYSIVDNSKQNYVLQIQGDLTIAGVTQKKLVEAHCISNESKGFICQGETKLKMTDFDIIPPSFMLGAMKTGDEITIVYKIYFKNKKQ